MHIRRVYDEVTSDLFECEFLVQIYYSKWSKSSYSNSLKSHGKVSGPKFQRNAYAVT